MTAPTEREQMREALIEALSWHEDAETGRWGSAHAEAVLDDYFDAEHAELRAKVARVEALLTAWGEIPDHTATHYDRGRVDQRHMAALELAAALEGDS